MTTAKDKYAVPDVYVCPACGKPSGSKSALIDGLVAAVVEWAASEDGKRQMAENRERVNETLRRLDEERTLTREQLNTPMTI
jgi:hypothetical protein